MLARIDKVVVTGLGLCVVMGNKLGPHCEFIETLAFTVEFVLKAVVVVVVWDMKVVKDSRLDGWLATK